MSVSSVKEKDLIGLGIKWINACKATRTVTWHIGCSMHYVTVDCYNNHHKSTKMKTSDMSYSNKPGLYDRL